MRSDLPPHAAAPATAAHDPATCPSCAAGHDHDHKHDHEHDHRHGHAAPGGHGHTAGPYRDAAEHFADHGARLLLFLKRYVLRYWPRLTDAGGSLSDVYVSVHEALHALGAALPGGHELPEALRDEATAAGLAAIEAELSVFDGHIRERLALSMDGVALPCEELRAIYRLSDAELDVLLTLARIQSDLEFSRLCTFAWADFTRKQPDVAFLVDLLSVPVARRGELTLALAPEGTLVREGLVTLHDAGDWQPATPHFFRRAAVPDRLVRFLNVGPAALVQLPANLRFVTGAPSPAALCLDPAAREQATAAWRAAAARPGGGTALLFTGPRGVGKKTLAATLAAGGGRRLLAVDVEALLASAPLDAARLIAEAAREALLQGALLLVDLGSGLPPAAEHGQRHALDALAGAFAVPLAPVVFAATQPQSALAALGAVIEVPLPFTPLSEQQRAWREALQSGPGLAPGLDPDYLAGRFNLTAGSIRRTVENATAIAAAGRFRRDRPAGPGSLAEADLAMAARNQLGHNLGSLATPVFTTHGFGDLVLPAETLDTLREIERMMQFRARVYDDWGFNRVVGGRQGLRVLFSGPPGTGKTLAASVIGRSLARDVYRIDLSRVLDKYIGETEKNLARLFDESEYAHVLLLFDEADSLFAGRTNVKSVHDRYANVQVNFLLQRIESFEGICILTTNFEENIDEAFKRRLQAWVRFPKPDRAAREDLWRQMIPEKAAVAPNLDFATLAGEFEFSGGHIKNAALRAAFAAAAEGRPIGLAHLRAAAVTEARQLGQLVRVPVGAATR